MSTGLAVALRPLDHILSAPETEDLAIQEPGAGWVYRAGAWHRVELPEMTYNRLHGIAVMAASQTGQRINPRSPILSTDLFGGAFRLQAVAYPAVPAGTLAFTFRRPDTRLDEVEDVTRLFDTSRWNKWSERNQRRGRQDAALLERFDAGDLPGFLRGCAETRQTGLFCGPTGAGKSRMSRMCGTAISLRVRIITIEDASELRLRQPNVVRHYYAASGEGVTQTQLAKATLRERPGIVLLGEMREPEAVYVFVDEVMAGHPGSMSTAHGRNPPECARRLFNMFKSSSAGRSMADETVVGMLANALDFIVPVENDDGVRAIGEVWFRADAQRRGETFADLLRAA